MSAHECRFEHVVMAADSPANPHCKAAGDLDGDGRADVAAASARDGFPDVVIGALWYRNPDGDPDGDWKACRCLDADHFHTCSTEGEVVVQAGDIDGTGRLRIVGANWNDRAPTGGAIEAWINEGA